MPRISDADALLFVIEIEPAVERLPTVLPVIVAVKDADEGLA